MATKLKVPRGATFRKGWVWYDGEDIRKDITAIARGFPTVLTAPTHSLTSIDTPVALLNVDELSTVDSSGQPSFATKDRILAHAIDASTFSVEIDSTEFSAYDGVGGRVVHRPPKDLTGYTARMQFRPTISSDLLWLELTELDGITLRGVLGAIDIVLTDVQTTAFPKNFGVWNIELIDPVSEDVTRFDEGTIELSADVNRPVV